MTHRWDFVRSSHDAIPTTPAALKNPSNASSIRMHSSSTHSNQHLASLPSAQRRTSEQPPATEETVAAVGFTSQSLTFTQTTNQSKRGGGVGGRAVNTSSSSTSSSSSAARRQRGERLALEFAADDFHHNKSSDHTRYIVNYDTFSGCDNKSGEAVTTITTNNDDNRPPSPHSPHKGDIDIDLNLDHLTVDHDNNLDEDEEDQEEQFSSDNRSTNLASSDTCGGGIISYNSYKQRLHDRQPFNESDLHATFGHKLDKNQQPNNAIPKRIYHAKTPSHGDLSSIDHQRATHPSDHMIRRQRSQGSKDTVTQISQPKNNNNALEQSTNSIALKDAEIKRLQETVNILEEELRAAEISLLKHQSSSWSQRNRSGSPGGGVHPHQQHNKQIDNCQQIDVLRADNSQLTQKINRISESSAQTKLLLESEINKLAQENHKLRAKASVSSSSDASARKLSEMSVQLASLTKQMKDVSQENTRLLSEVRVLEERTKELVNQNNQLATVNEVQFDDIQRLAVSQTALINEIQQANLRKGGDLLEETSRQTEQLRFNLTKELEEKFNMRVQEIYYKTHKQIDQYKQQLLLLKNAQVVQVPIDTRREYPHSSSSGSNTQRLTTTILSPQQHMLPPDDTGRSRLFSGKDRNESNERGDSKEKTTVNTHRSIPPLVMKERSQIQSTHLRSEEVENIGSRTRRSTCHSNSKSRSSTIVSTTATTADIERRVAWEICGILRSDSLESLPNVVAKLKDSQKQLQKFADCIIEMVVTCNPQRSFEETTQLLPDTHRDTGRMRTQMISSITQQLPPSHQQPPPPPSLKQSWKWLKQIMEEFMQLKTILPGLKEFENNVCTLLNATNRQEAQRFIQEKVSECATANRISKKVSDIFRIPPSKNQLDLENTLNRIHAQQSQPPRHSASSSSGSLTATIKHQQSD